MGAWRDGTRRCADAPGAGRPTTSPSHAGPRGAAAGGLGAVQPRPAPPVPRATLRPVTATSVPLPDHPDRLWRHPEPKASYDVVVIGGGGHRPPPAHPPAQRPAATPPGLARGGGAGGGEKDPPTRDHPHKQPVGQKAA